VVIIMAVMANTMTMTARERLAEYATLKALGFPPGFVVRLLFGESLLIAPSAAWPGMAADLPLAAAFAQCGGHAVPGVPGVDAHDGAAAGRQHWCVGLVAAAWPAWKMSRIDIVNGLRHVG
jgi:putative ABC transport system permease protein